MGILDIEETVNQNDVQVMISGAAKLLFPKQDEVKLQKDFYEALMATYPEWVVESLSETDAIVRRSKIGRELIAKIHEGKSFGLKFEDIPDTGFIFQYDEVENDEFCKKEKDINEYLTSGILGLYDSVGKEIRLDIEKIEKCANSLLVSPSHIFIIVLIHEMMHFLMDSSIWGNFSAMGYPNTKLSSFWMEESYANQLTYRVIKASNRRKIIYAMTALMSKQYGPYNLSCVIAFGNRSDYKEWIKEKVLIQKNTASGPIVLISCSSRQMGINDCPSRFEYDKSTYFRLSYRYALTLNPSKIFILSTNYGLITPDTVISTYNISPSSRSKSWSSLVNTSVNKNIPTFSDVVILAGSDFCKGWTIHTKTPIPKYSNQGIGQIMHYLKTELDKYYKRINL